MTFNVPFIPPLNPIAMERARLKQERLTKPAGSLGRLEHLSIQLAGIIGTETPSIKNKTVIIMAGDHGVVQEKVSAYPSDVTPQMVMNFLNGGAAINALARLAGARVVVVDIGVAADTPKHPDLQIRKIALGTRNMAAGPAMTREQAELAISTGIQVVQEEIDRGTDVIATGDMGIGNTTPSSAITAVLCGLPVEKVTGRGTGVDNAGLIRKIQTIKTAIEINHPDPQDPIDVLGKVGGLEIAGLVGVILGAAAKRKPVVIDGFISGAAALIAAKLAPECGQYMIGSHMSVETGHQYIYEQLGLKALLNLDLRLGEGTGAALAFHLLDAAVIVLLEMATFEEAGVSKKED